MLSEESTVSNEWGRAHGRMSMSPGHMRWTGRMEGCHVYDENVRIRGEPGEYVRWISRGDGNQAYGTRDCT